VVSGKGRREKDELRKAREKDELRKARAEEKMDEEQKARFFTFFTMTDEQGNLKVATDNTVVILEPSDGTEDRKKFIQCRGSPLIHLRHVDCTGNDSDPRCKNYHWSFVGAALAPGTAVEHTRCLKEVLQAQKEQESPKKGKNWTAVALGAGVVLAGLLLAASRLASRRSRT